MHFDVSPDGSHIAYSACAYNRKSPEDTRDDEWVYNYDIALANMDGTEVQEAYGDPWIREFSRMVA